MKHGRKEIRPKKFSWSSVIIFINAACVVLLCFVLGVLVGTPRKETQLDVTEQVKKFGGYDTAVISEEPDLEWTVSEDFKPLDCEMDEDTQAFVYYLCESYDIDWTLTMAVIKQESNFQADTVSATGDYGLMQINKCNHSWLSEQLGVNDFLNEEQNIRAGVFVLRKLFEQYTDTNMVLMAYNMGEGGAANLWEKGIYETNYTRNVRQYQSEFQEGVKNDEEVRIDE